MRKREIRNERSLIGNERKIDPSGIYIQAIVQNTKEVIKAIDELERLLGNKEFRRMFKTVTCDNGCEFLDQKGLEQSIGEGERFTVYYFTHTTHTSAEQTKT